jgi:hypothetical protein
MIVINDDETGKDMVGSGLHLWQLPGRNEKKHKKSQDSQSPG